MSTNQPEDNPAGRSERTGPSDPAQDGERATLGSWITNRARPSQDDSDDTENRPGNQDDRSPADQSRGDASESSRAAGIGGNAAHSESSRDGLHAEPDRDRLNEGNNRNLTGDAPHGSTPVPGPVPVNPSTPDPIPTTETVPGPDGYRGDHTSTMDVQGDADANHETRAMPLTHTKDPHDDQRGRDGRSHSQDDDARDLDRERNPRSEAAGPPLNRESLLRREKDQFGGMKFGSAFFGWLTATGLTVLLTALAVAIGSVIGASNNVSINEVATKASEDPASVGIPAAITIGVILLLSYFAGGYVAGRMARFSGMKQGVAVWLWAIIIAIIMTILSVILGDQFSTAVADMNTFPELDAGAFTTGGVIALLVALAIALIGAILGGLTGMRYHRKIDKATYDGDPELERQAR